MAKASETYHDQLGSALSSLPDGAKSYFSSHALTRDILHKYQIGYVVTPLPGDERFTGMLSLPYLSPAGVVCIKFRSLSSTGAKYSKHGGSKNRLYNAPAYFAAGTTIGISEGEMDAICATEYLGVPTLGVPGVEAWKSEWGALLKDFSTVFLFGDGDVPGREFAAEMSDIIGWRARIVQCPEGEDVSSMCASGRSAELAALVTTSNDLDEA